MVHSSSWSPPVGQSTARNWDERMDLHSSTQTSVHIYHGCEDDKTLNNCFVKQARPIYNVCQSQLKIHFNAKMISFSTLYRCVKGKIGKKRNFSMMMIKLAASWANRMCNTHDVLQHKPLPPLYVDNISCSHTMEVSANIKQQCSSTVFVVFMNGCFLAILIVAAFLVVLYDIDYIHSSHVNSNF